MALALMFFAFPTTHVLGAEFISPDDSGNLTLPASDTHRNLYTAGGNVLINSTIQGDLYVAGGSVTVEGNVEGDLIAAAGTVYINGTVGGDVRSVGGDITVNNTVGGDVVMAGGSIILSDRAVVAGDVVVAGGQFSISGPVAGNLTVYGESVDINSAITGAVRINADEKLTIGSNAVFGEDASYKSWQEASIADGAQVSSLSYEQVARKQSGNGAEAFGVIFSVAFIIKLLAMILAALLLVKLFPRKANEFVHHLDANKWSNLGVGFIGLVAAPIIAIIALISFVGLYAGLIVLLLWILWMVVGSLVGIVYVGTWINKMLTKKPDLVIDWQSVVMGVVVMSVVALVPVVGWIVMMLVMFAGFGTILRQIAAIIRSQQIPSTPSSVINN